VVLPPLRGPIEWRPASGMELLEQCDLCFENVREIGGGGLIIPDQPIPHNTEVAFCFLLIRTMGSIIRPIVLFENSRPDANQRFVCVLVSLEVLQFVGQNATESTNQI